MYTPRAPTVRALCGSQATSISKAVIKSLSGNPVIQTTLLIKPTNCRLFSTTPHTTLEYFPPPKDAPSIKVTSPAWRHPGFTADEMKAVEVAHRQPRNWPDKIAYAMVNLLRWGTDKATGYHHQMEIETAEKKGNKSYAMDERKWMIRFIFLETVAGVPGMVGASLRHLHSLRRMKRDNGWIESLLEEAYNERMHLLTFMKLAEPGWFMKMMILGAQGVFYNGFFLSYLLSPRICHRFVGYLEEQAVNTYTHALHDLESGRLPAWENMEAPDIAVKYWEMPEGHRTLRDLLYYIRADESKHREVNHTLGNLDPKVDPNPYVSTYKDNAQPHPSTGLYGGKSPRPVGWEREEVI